MNRWINKYEPIYESIERERDAKFEIDKLNQLLKQITLV